VKQPADIVDLIRGRLTRDWPALLMTPTDSDWPWRLPLGRPTSAELAGRFPEVQRWAFAWAAWASDNDLVLDTETRAVHGTRQTTPTHVTIPTLDVAAGLAREPWPHTLFTARSRRDVMTRMFGDRVTTLVIRQATALTEADYLIALDAAQWFAHNDATGLTPRQVPVIGLHAKWLDNHHRLITALAGREHLGLVTRPTRIHYTYLDPDYLDGGGRQHDAHTIGDSSNPAYRPQVAIISENKDTALYFPQFPHAVAIEGNGNTGPTVLPKTPWVHDIPHLIYWGDIDTAGLTILNAYRANGLAVTSILMDPSTYREYAPFGTGTDRRGKTLTPIAPLPLPHLTPQEHAAYLLVCSGETGPLRIEQERIPLDEAVVAVKTRLAATQTTRTTG
jgi:hypothetical protein